MFMEALCALADDLSYYQDRIAAEATIATVTQRRSLTRLARLVDYDPLPATSSSVLLQFEVTGGPIPSGLLAHAAGPDGSSIDFETGTGLVDPDTLLLNTATYPVSPSWNRFRPDHSCNIVPYYWDDSQRCLPAGAVEMWVEGHGFQFFPGQQLLLDTAAQTTADPPVREIVTLTSATEETDPLFLATAHPSDLAERSGESSRSYAHHAGGEPGSGNAGQALHGKLCDRSAAAWKSAAARHRAYRPECVGTQYLYTLQNNLLTRLAQPDSSSPPLPEIVLTEQPRQTALPPVQWTWRRSLLDAAEFEQAYTVDPASYVRIASNSDGSASYDYDGDSGATIRFGDDLFGGIPQTGSLFRVTYRVGGSAAGNVAADTITLIDTGADPSIASLATAVTNPFAATGGSDEETAQQVARRAPQAFRAVQFRAVTPADYQMAAETLPWVLRAGTRFRWTGSWLTAFTTADPEGTERITTGQQTDLINLLNRYRMAGYGSYVPAPVYVGIDLRVTVCALPTAFQGDVESAVVAALSATQLPGGATGFFFLDRFTFGTPLERSALEAAIQSSYGVAGVVSIQYRKRGVTGAWACLPETLAVGPDQILRMDNDPSRPERGALTVTVEGGK